ncbi:MAG: histidine kinase [Bacteroidota bacterium]
MKRLVPFLIFVFVPVLMAAQKFDLIPTDLLNGPRPMLFRQILPTTKGTVLMANTLTNLSEIDKMQLDITWSTGYPLNDKGQKAVLSGRSDVFKDLFEWTTGVKYIAEGPGKVIYFVTDSNHIGLINYTFGRNAFAFPPFFFPVYRNQKIMITSIWIDTNGDLFVGTSNDTLYIVKDAARVLELKDSPATTRNNNQVGITNYTTGFDSDSNIIVTEGAKQVKKIFLGKGVIPYCFAKETVPDDDMVYIGTNAGLYQYENATNFIAPLFMPTGSEKITITHIFSGETSAYLWLSTLEKGMGRFSKFFGKSIRWFPYKNSRQGKTLNPIQTFCRKSAHEFFVAPLDSVPAVFNTETGLYSFINDTSFKATRNHTSDIKMDGTGSLFVIKDGRLFIAKNIITDPSFAEVKIDSTISQVVIADLLIRNVSYTQYNNYEVFDIVRLKHYQNDLGIILTARGFNSGDTLEFSWRMEGYNNEWQAILFSMLDEKINSANFPGINPGKYIFHARVRKANEEWRKPEAVLTIIISPPFWKTWWFWTVSIAGLLLIIYLIVWFRVRAVRGQERIKAAHEKEILQLEAKALRAQMNPHFIFNCLNSIKSLIQQNENERSVTYLTTFSKLIRTLFNNADKKEISLYDEIETCKLYLQLEAMRFDAKFSYSVNVDENIDLKSVKVPALIIQPFIENAIWHGIVPKGASGHVELSVRQEAGAVEIIIDDNGIGRETSLQNKAETNIGHQSKGVNLTQSRLELDNLLQQRQARLEIIDKKDKAGNAAGTGVTISFPQEV